MGFIPDNPGGRFVPDEEEKSVGGFLKNAATDVKDIGVGLGGFAKTALTQNPVKTALEMPFAVGQGLWNEGKRLGIEKVLPNSNPAKPFDPMGAAKQFAEAAYEKPVTTALDVLPAFDELSGLRAGSKIGKGVEAASETAPIADELIQGAKAAPAAADDVTRVAPVAGDAVNVGDEAAQILKEAPTAPLEKPPVAPVPEPPTGIEGIVDKTVTHLGNKAREAIQGPMDQVGDYLSQKYQKVAAKPGWSDTLTKYLDEYAQNSTLKNMGASIGQLMEIGNDAAGKLARFAMDRKISSPGTGSIGMGEKIADLGEKSGGIIGGIRKIATERGARYNLEDVLNRVKGELDDKYLKGAESGQKGTYLKALSEVQRAEPTAQGLAELSTKLNKVATGAKKLKQAHSAFTDISNTISRYNNERIGKFLDPKELNDYQTALAEYGAKTKLEQFFKRKQAREAAGRLGPGGGLRQLFQKGLDEFGYKFQAKIADGLSTFLKRNPGKAGNPHALFQEFINQVEDVWDDLGENIQ